MNKLKCCAVAAGATVGIALGFDAAAVPVHGLTVSNDLVRFDSATPGATSAPVAITGLVGGDSILGIDFRPANGLLYGLGSGSRLYTINPTTGAATQVGASGAFTLSGTSFGFDFNPVPDRIRVTSDADQNVRLNPNNGGLAATDGTLAYAAGDANAGADPNITGSAYTNSFAGAATTTLYDIDSALDLLTIQAPPNDGVLGTVGALGFDTTADVGFDIHFFGNQAFASLTGAGGPSSLFSIDLTSGAASLIGGIGSGLSIRDIAIEQVPEPETLLLMSAGLIGIVGLRRRQAVA